MTASAFDFGGDDFSDFFEGSSAAARAAAARNGFERLLDAGRRPRGGARALARGGAAGGKRRISLGDGRDFEVNVPPGVRDGQRIRLAGEGGRGIGGGPSGDLFLRVRIRPHPRFRVDGRDLYTDLPVTPWEAALGATVEVPHARRARARVRCPPARRAAAGCGCAARACRAPGAARATSTRSSRSRSRSSRPRGARALRAARRGLELQPPQGPADGASTPAHGTPARAPADGRRAGSSRSRCSRARRACIPSSSRRFVRLGLLEPRRRDRAAPLSRATRRRAWRARRACAATSASTTPAPCSRVELLARIDQLEERLRRYEPRPTARGDGMDPNQLTQKTQEALHDAQTKALRYGHTEIDVEHLLLALLDQPDGLVPRLLRARWTSTRRRCTATSSAARGPPARERAGRRRASARMSRALAQLLDAAEQEARAPEGRVRLGRARPARDARLGQADRRRPAAARARRHARALPRGADRGARQPARDERDPGVGLRGAREVRPRPRRRGAQRQARPGDRPRRGDPPRRSRSSRARPRTTRC